MIVVDTFDDTFVWNEAGGTYIPVECGLSFKDGIDIALDATDPNYHTQTQTRVVISENIPGLDPNAWVNDLLEQLVESVRSVIAAAAVDAALWP